MINTKMKLAYAVLTDNLKFPNQTLYYLSNIVVYVFVLLMQNRHDNKTRYVTMMLTQKGAVSKTIQTATDQCNIQTNMNTLAWPRFIKLKL